MILSCLSGSQSDARSPHPVETAGHPQESQALGGSGMEPAEPVNLSYGQDQLALVGLRRPPPLRRLRASLNPPPVGF